MNFESKFARFLRNSGPARVLAPAGLILIIFGFIFNGMKADTYLETTGRVISVVEHMDAENKATVYDVSFTYQANGKEYTGIFEDQSRRPEEGSQLKVLYDPADPTRITNTRLMGIIAPIMIGFGALIMIYAILRTVKAFKKSSELASGMPFPLEDFKTFKEAPGVTEYYFRWDGSSLKPGYIMEDAKRSLLFEGQMIKNALVGPRSFEFRNHVSGHTQEHQVGHTISEAFNNNAFSVRSWFKIDGKNVWDLLHEKGLRMSTDAHSKFPYFTYYVAKDGIALALIENTGKYVHEDEAAEHKVNMPTGKMFYRIWTNSDDFETLFLTVFAISETEQAFIE